MSVFKWSTTTENLLPLCSCLLVGLLGFVFSLLISTPREFGLLLNTLRLVLCVELLSLPVAILLALLLARTNLIGRHGLLMVVSSLLLMPLYLQLCGWDAAFGVLGWFTLSRIPRVEPWLAGFRAAVVIHAVYAIPWATWLMTAMFRYGRREWEEQALLEGTAWQVWRMITVPQLTSGVMLAALWVFIITSGEMTVTNIYMVRTYAENVYSHFAGSGDLEAVLPHIASLMLFIISLVLLAFGALLLLPANLHDDHAYRWQLTGSRLPSSMSAGLFVLMLIAFPLVNLLHNAGFEVTSIAGKPERTWSLAKTLQIMAETPSKFYPEFRETFIISLMVTFACLIIGGACAWWTRQRTRFSTLGWLLAAIGLALPGPIVGIAIIRLLNQPGSELLLWLYDRTVLPPVLALCVRCLPLAYLGLWWAWRSLDGETLAAAELEGAGEWRRFVAIALPQRTSMVAMLAIMIFALASGDLSVSLLTLPPGMSTIAQRMFGLVHSGVNDQVAGIGIVCWLFYLSSFAMLSLGQNSYSCTKS